MSLIENFKNEYNSSLPIRSVSALLLLVTGHVALMNASFEMTQNMEPYAFNRTVERSITDIENVASISTPSVMKERLSQTYFDPYLIAAGAELGAVAAYALSEGYKHHQNENE